MALLTVAYWSLGPFGMLRIPTVVACLLLLLVTGLLVFKLRLAGFLSGLVAVVAMLILYGCQSGVPDGRIATAICISHFMPSR